MTIAEILKVAARCGGHCSVFIRGQQTSFQGFVRQADEEAGVVLFRFEKNYDESIGVRLDEISAVSNVYITDDEVNHEDHL